MGPNIEVHIEELVLHGFAHGDEAGIQAAVETELARLLAEQGAPVEWASGVDKAQINGEPFTVAPKADPHQIGAQVAQGLYGGLAQ